MQILRHTALRLAILALLATALILPAHANTDYDARVKSIARQLFQTAGEICTRGAPAAPQLVKAGFSQNADGVWQRGGYLLSFGDGFTGQGGYYCLITALNAKSDRPADGAALFAAAMAREISGRFNGDPDTRATVTRKSLNYVFELHNIGTGNRIADGVIVPPASAVPSEIGGLLINFP